MVARGGVAVDPCSGLRLAMNHNGTGRSILQSGSVIIRARAGLIHAAIKPNYFFYQCKALI